MNERANETVHRLTTLIHVYPYRQVDLAKNFNRRQRYVTTTEHNGDFIYLVIREIVPKVPQNDDSN